MQINTMMKQLKLWMLAAILTCGATVFTSCLSDKDDNPSDSGKKEVRVSGFVRLAGAC